MREDLKNREAHWGATLSRYRLKIESLEAENKELQEDLRMMEQERLLTWQMQVSRSIFAKTPLPRFIFDGNYYGV